MYIAKTHKQLPQDVLKKLSEANVFYEIEYAKFERDNNTKVVFLYNENFIQVVCLHTIHVIFHTARLISEPFVLQKNVEISRLQGFLDDVVVTLKKKWGIDWVTVTPASSVFKSYPSSSQRIRFGNYIIDLSTDENNLFSRLSSKHRNMVRRGEKENIEVRFGGLELLDDYISVDKQTWARNGRDTNNTAIYKKFITNLDGHAIVGVAYKDDIPQCGLIGCFNLSMFYYMYGASADRPEPGSTHFLQWQTICRMKKLGVHLYNFVGCRINVDLGSKYEKIQHFKIGFGGELEECYMFRVTIHRFKKWLFNKLLKIKLGNAPSDVIDQEIDKWKEIN